MRRERVGRAVAARSGWLNDLPPLEPKKAHFWYKAEKDWDRFGSGGIKGWGYGFTLCADCSHGRRPNFIAAARPEKAEPLYEYFCAQLKENGVSQVEKGVFGADMQVSLVNDGPVTIDINSKDLKR